ncbi:MAG: CGNR zinc finger domain-containing protein [Acidobacteriota bacterium]
MAKNPTNRPDLSPHPAPGDLKIVQDYLNTRDPETGDDHLSSPEALTAWLGRWPSLAFDGTLDEAAWRDALAARSGLRALIAQHGSARRPRGAADGAAVEALNQALRGVRPALHFATDGSLRLQSSDTGWAGALGRLILIVSAAIESGHWQRLKACHNEACQLVFFDAARNRSGKWCTGRKCGNRINARTYRRRGPVHWRLGS